MDQYQQRERKHDKGSGVLVILAVALVVLFIASLLFPVSYRQFHLSPAWIFEHVKQRMSQFYLFVFSGDSTFGITLYQYIAVVLVGSALAACGCVFQGAFRNSLAGPSTMGVMSGGSLGTLIYVLLFVSASAEPVYTTFDSAAYELAQATTPIWITYRQQFSTLLGCVGGVALVLLVATAAGRGKLSASVMILSGTVFSSIISQFTMIIQYYIILQDPNDIRIEIIRDLMMGSFDNVTTLRYLLLMGIPILLCLVILIALSNRLNLLSLGEEEALTMGVDIRPLRYVVIALGTILTAVVVSFCGRIGFLGFMIPLVGRKLVGPDMRRLLPASLMLGSILLLLVFDLAYILGLTSYINLFTSAVGSLVMLFTLFLKKGGVQLGSSKGAAMGGMGFR